jgi:hypothetical protein
MLLLRKSKIILLSILITLNCLGGITDKGGLVRDIGFVPNATFLRKDDFTVLKRATNESSTFFFLGLFPVTKPLNIEYALSQAVQSVDDGDTIINIHVWHETHYYFPLGTVSVCKVEGDVISLKTNTTTPLFEAPVQKVNTGETNVGKPPKGKK